MARTGHRLSGAGAGPAPLPSYLPASLPASLPALSSCRALVPAGPLREIHRAGEDVGQLQAVVAPHPFGHERRLVWDVLLPGESLAAYLERAVPEALWRPVTVRLAGHRVPRAMWARTWPRGGQLIEVQAVVEGGSGRKVARTVAQIGLIALSIWNPLGWGKVALAAFSIGGSLAINKLLPPIVPQRNRNAEQPSPTYSLAGAQNRARPYEPLPVLLGTHRIVPDLGAAQYTEFEGEDQYLYAVFNFGLDSPMYRIENLKIGDTPIESFAEVQLEWSGTTGALTLAAGNVDTVAGGALTAAASWITRTGSTLARELAIDIEGLLFYTGDNGIEPRSVTVDAEYRLVGSGTWLPFFVSGFTNATSYWSKGYTDANTSAWIQVDFDTNLAAGAHTEGESAGTLNDDNGFIPVGPIALTWSYKTVAAANTNGWSLPPLAQPSANATSQVITSGTTKPLRRSFRRAVASGQYEMRVRRATGEETDPRATSEITWTALRTYQTDTADYTGQKRLAVKIKASGQLQGALDALSATGKRMAFGWVGPNSGSGYWSLLETSNPAWLLHQWGRGLFIGERRVFGLGLAADKVDYDALIAWATWCTAKGLTFNGVVDQTLSNRQVGDAIAAAGWARLSFEGGKLGVIWDADGLPVTGVVNMANIVAGSLRVTYDTEPAADEIVCTYLNAANGYAQEQVRVPAAATAPRKVQTFDLWGVTDRDQAGRAANLRYAEQVYRRKIIEWEQDAEGTIAREGEVLAFSHDMTQWGYGGRVVSLSGATAGSTLVLDRRVPANLTAVNDEWVGIRVPGESGYRVLRVQCTPAGANNDNDTLTLVDAWPGGVDLPGATRPALDYLWVYDFRSTPGYRVKVLAKRPVLRPDGTLGARLRAVPDVAEFYAAEGGTFGVVAPVTLLNATPVVSGLVITSERKREGDIFVAELVATWSANDQYASALVTGVVTVSGTPKAVEIGSVSAGQRRIVWRASLVEKAWTVTVRPYNGAGQPGAAVSASHTVTVLDAPPPAPTTLTLGSSAAKRRLLVAMTDVPADLAGFVIRYQSGATITWASASAFGQYPLAAGSTSPFACEATVPEAAGTYSFEVRTLSKAGVVSSTGAQLLNQQLTVLPAVVAYLTSEACTLAANSSGDVADFSPASTTMKVLLDGADDSANWTYSKSDATGITSAINTSTGVCNVLSMSADSSYVDITAARTGYASLTKRFNVAKARAGVGGTGDSGAPGPTGARGSQWFYISGQTAWSDSVADSHITGLGLTKVARDVVTMYGTLFAQTRQWDGAAWVVIAVAVDGNLLVDGTVTAEAFTTNLKSDQATLIRNSDFTDYAGTNNGIAALPGWAQYTGTLPANHQIVRNNGGGRSWNIGRGGAVIYYNQVGYAGETGIYQTVGVNGSVQYELHFSGSLHRTNGRVAINWRDSGGAFISQTSQSIAEGIGATAAYLPPIVCWLSATSPANAVFADVHIIATSATDAGSYLFMHRVHFAPIVPGASATNPTPWKPAGSVEIHGGAIVAETIAADRMQAGLFSADNVLTRNLTVRDASGNIILSAGQALDWSRLMNQPGGIYNSNVSIGANGALTGAGGGQVTLGGLGAGAVAWLNTVPDAYISSLAVNKLLAGALAVGQYIQSTNYVAGVSGWRINHDGAAEFGDGTFRGAVTATSFSGSGVVGQTAIALGAIGSSTSSSFAQSTIYSSGGSTFSYNGLILATNSSLAWARSMGCVANGYAIVTVSGPGSGVANRRVRMSVQLTNYPSGTNVDLAEVEASIFFPTDYANTLQVTLPFSVSTLVSTSGQGAWQLKFQFYCINEDNETQVNGLASIALYQRMNTVEINR
jgi:hypothetical protein